MRYIILYYRSIHLGDLSCRLVHDQPKLHQGTHQLRNLSLTSRKQARAIKQTKHVHCFPAGSDRHRKSKRIGFLLFFCHRHWRWLNKVLNLCPRKAPRLYWKQERFQSISNSTKIPTDQLRRFTNASCSGTKPGAQWPHGPCSNETWSDPTCAGAEPSCNRQRAIGCDTTDPEKQPLHRCWQRHTWTGASKIFRRPLHSEAL